MTMQPPQPRPSPPLLSLQVLRAVAALLVLVHHAAYDADTIALHDGAAPFALDRFVDLAFGIHLFFVISGFIMLRTARGFGSARGAAVFMARRVVRVVPLYWVMTSLVILGAAVAPGLLNTPVGGLAGVVGSYLFVPVLRGGQLVPVLGQGWTLDYEMFFYALFALAMLLPRRAAIACLAAMLIGLVSLGRVIQAPAAPVAVWTDGLLLEFLLGLGIGLLAERGRRLDARSAGLVVALGCLGAVALGPVSGLFHGLALWIREGIPAAFVVGGCVLGPRWGAGRVVLPLALVGDASYSLYLSHPFAVRLMRAAWLALVPAGVPVSLYLAAACATAVLLGLALHRWVERPMTDWLQRHSRMTGAAATPILPRTTAVDPARQG